MENFLDETYVFQVVSNTTTTIQQLNHELMVTSEWAYQLKILTLIL